MRKNLFIFSLFIIVLSCSPTLGQTAEVLTWNSFIQTAIKQNPQYQVTIKEYLAAIYANKSANAIEDWNLVAAGIIQDASSPNQSSAFYPTYQHIAGYSVGVNKYVEQTGTAISIEHNNNRINADYNNIPISGFTPTSPYYTSDLTISISQPLLKNAFGLAAKKGLAISDETLNLAGLKLGEDWEDFINTLRNDYLAWQEYKTNIDIYDDKAEKAEKQLALLKKQAAYGLSEELDLVQIEQKLQAYKLLLEQAKMAYQTQTNKILKTIGTPLTSQAEPEKFKPDGKVAGKEQALAYLENDSNLKKTLAALASIKKAGLAIKENAELMDVNLALQARPNAFSHGFADSINKIGSNNEYTLTLSGSKPFFNTKADADTEQAQADYEKTLKQNEQTMLSAQIGLNTLYTNLEYLNNMITLNQKNLELAKKMLDLEYKKYQQGRTSIFFVLQAEDSVLAAESTLCQIMFAREKTFGSIKSLTDQYLVEYKESLKI